MNLTNEERIRCNECLKKLYQIKLMCIQSIQYLIEQQHEIDECIADLKSTKLHAEAINEKISTLNQMYYVKICCLNRKRDLLETTNSNDPSQMFILSFPNEQSNGNNYAYGLNELENDFELEKLIKSVNNSYPQLLTKDDFEHILHEEYTTLFEFAKKLTKCVQILHDTIEFLGTDIKLTLEHMQLAQPRMRQLLKLKAPLAFAQVQHNRMI
ncbi:unnamed protein product [Rotaria socialis]|uniref:Uncharacterized protein n=1 Tax=Rotaria socialis TaxID=392032 RepID=A0A818G6L0_9BILA|nr:unnamed protein product [Rotaria socialis]CAF3330889.1 unnamed protein product [Rotaria socialis]CAF3360895.1 unnamed protein product [Rotaria socialis]CAF3487254.1 unnamed protein product [Rotaria socialis]CAF3534192.1 unnamed protein product [Rotaria socialis]